MPYSLQFSSLSMSSMFLPLFLPNSLVHYYICCIFVTYIICVTALVIRKMMMESGLIEFSLRKTQPKMMQIILAFIKNSIKIPRSFVCKISIDHPMETRQNHKLSKREDELGEGRDLNCH